MRLIWALALSLLMLLSGCSLIDRPERTDPPIVEDRNALEPVEPKPIAKPDQPVEQRPPVKAKAPQIAIVVTRDIPLYRSVEDALTQKLPSPAVIRLDDPATTGLLTTRLAEVDAESVIAIGDEALAAVADLDVPVVHAQVFNAATGRGVPVFPPLDMQMEAWRTLSPDLVDVGVVASPAMVDHVEALISAAAEQGLRVHSVLAGSDKEALFEFRRLVPRIQRFVFFVDAAIMSPGVIQKMMAHAVKNDVEVLTNSLAIFNLGAALLVTATAEDVADKAIALTKDPDLTATELAVARVRLQGSQSHVDFER